MEQEKQRFFFLVSLIICTLICTTPSQNFQMFDMLEVINFLKYVHILYQCLFSQKVDVR
jgi:hypothetical protein